MTRTGWFSALFLLALLAIASNASAGDVSATLVVDQPGRNLIQETVELPSDNMTAHRLLELGAGASGFNYTTTYWPGSGTFLDTIGGVGFNSSTWEYWAIYVLNSTNGTWETSMVGMDSIILEDGDAVSFCYTNGTYIPRPYTPVTSATDTGFLPAPSAILVFIALMTAITLIRHKD